MSSIIKGTVATEGNLKGHINTASGFDGKSAYEIALQNGFEGTEQEWLDSLQGKDGKDGNPGIYVGSGDMPDDCNVQIDPDGDVLTVEQIFEEATTKSANALKGNKSGTDSISITDISPIKHDVPCSVENKNLIPYPYSGTTKTVNGITFTDNGDGTITVNGTASNYSFFNIISNDKAIVLPKGTYTFSGCPSGGGNGNYYMYMVDDNNKEYIDAGKGITFTLTTDMSNVRFFIYMYANAVVENIVFKPQLEIGSTATEYTPFVDLSAVKVQRLGKNLCDGQLTQWAGHDTIRPINAIRVKRNTNYTISVVGATNSPTFSIFGNNTGVLKVYEDKQIAWQVTTFNSGEYDYIWFRLIGYNPDYNIDYNSKVQVEEGLATTEYEPYVVPVEYSANADGMVEGVKSLYPNMTLMTDTNGVIISAEYNRDINKAFAALEAAIANL